MINFFLFFFSLSIFSLFNWKKSRNYFPIKFCLNKFYELSILILSFDKNIFLPDNIGSCNRLFLASIRFRKSRLLKIEIPLNHKFVPSIQTINNSPIDSRSKRSLFFFSESFTKLLLKSTLYTFQTSRTNQRIARRIKIERNKEQRKNRKKSKKHHLGRFLSKIEHLVTSLSHNLLVEGLIAAIKFPITSEPIYLAILRDRIGLRAFHVFLAPLSILPFARERKSETVHRE